MWITLQTVGSKQIAWPRTRTPSLLSSSILSTRSRSDGCGELDLKQAALRRLLAAERPDGGGAGEIGSEGGGEGAHQIRRAVVMLKVLLA